MEAETTAKTAGDLFSEQNRIAGRLAGEAQSMLADRLMSGAYIGEDRFELASDAERRNLELDPEPEPWEALLIKRVRDGQFFEVDLEADVRRVAPVAGRAAPGGS